MPYLYEDNACLICGENRKGSFERHVQGEKLKYTCKYCGRYTISDIDACHIEQEQPEFFEKAAGLALERNWQGLGDYELRWDSGKKQACVAGIPFLSDYPKTFPDRLDRAFLILAKVLGFDATKDLSDRTLKPSMFFVDIVSGISDFDYSPDIRKLISILKERGYVRFEAAEDLPAQSAKSTFVDRILKAEKSPPSYLLSLTYEGVVKALELDAKKAASNHVFLAMWFDDSLASYRSAINEAVSAAGYTLKVVDDVHHNDFIMDKVLNLIKNSRFVIADLTCAPERIAENNKPEKGVRGGVYFEAGYARGLGKQLVLTCRDDSDARPRLHFDVQQVNTIFWKEGEHRELTAFGQPFIDYLKDRIIATIGKGSNYVENAAEA